MRKIVAPLALLASISLLTSCTKAPETPIVVPPVVETPAPVLNDGVPPAPPAPPEPPMPPAPPAPLSPDVPVTPADPAPTSSTVAPVARTETVSYQNPAGNDEVEFSVTVTDGVITAASATPKAVHDISKKRQEAFALEVSAKVVGMKAKDLDVDAIGGSSLTTGAFEMFVRSF